MGIPTTTAVARTFARYRDAGSLDSECPDVRLRADPDVAEYPETGKVGISTEGGDWQFHRRADAIEHAGPESS